MILPRRLITPRTQPASAPTERGSVYRMISWTWRIGSAYSSLPSVKTTSWRVVASVGIGFLRENWKCAPVIGPSGRLLSASASLVGKNHRPLHRALAADVHPLLDRAVGRRRRRAPPGCGEPPGRLEREAERRQRDRPGRGGGRLGEPRARELVEQRGRLVGRQRRRREAHEAVVGLLERARLVDALLEVGLDRAALGERLVDDRVGAGLVGADRDQVLLLLVGGHELAQAAPGLLDLARGDLRGEARDALEDVDRRVVPGVGEVAAEDDVAVEDRAGGVGDRLVHVVAVDEHGVEGGDRAVRARARALEELREHREDARRVAARGGRLADGEADLALGHGDARDRVHHQHDVGALVAEVLGDGGRDERALDAHERRLVGRRDDHDAALERVAEVALDELLDLSAALADERDHVDVGRRGPGDHAEQRRLADAGAGEDAEALAAPAGDDAVERADAERDAVLDAGPAQRVRRRPERRAQLRAVGLWHAVHRAAEAVEDAAEQLVADVDAHRVAGRRDGAAGGDAAHVAERHEQRLAAAEADDLGGHVGAPPAGGDHADLADLGLEAGRLDGQADEVRDAAVAAVQIGLAQAVGRALEDAGAHGATLWSSATMTSRARSSFVSRPASTCAVAVRRMAPPRPMRRSSKTSTWSMPPSSAASASIASRTIVRSSGLTSTCTRSRSMKQRSPPRTTSSTVSGRAATTPAPPLPASSRASSTAPASTRSAISARSASAAAMAACSAWTAGASCASASCCPAAAPSARPRARPSARACSRMASASARADSTTARRSPTAAAGAAGSSWSRTNGCAAIRASGPRRSCRG